MPKQKDETKVERIFDAALRQILQNGYAGLKMSAVAKEATLATGTIYTYFENKNALINALFRYLKQRKMKAVFKGYREDLPFKQGFKILWYNYLKAGLLEPEQNLFIKQYEKSRYLDEASVAIHLSAYQPFYAFLQKGQDANLIKKIPVKVLAAMLMGSCNELAHQYFGAADQIPNEVIDQCFDMVWESIKQ